MSFILILCQAKQNLQSQSSSIDFKDIASFILALVGLITLIFGLFQYKKGLLQKRSEQFLRMRERYVDNPEFQELFLLLETDDERLRNLPYKIKLKFLGFYEELALMVNSGLIKKEVAFYMFAYHAIRIWESNNFWFFNNTRETSSSEFNRESIYWSLFKKFTLDMCEYQKCFIQKMENDKKKLSIIKARFKL